jgi:hypothetical protein
MKKGYLWTMFILWVFIEFSLSFFLSACSSGYDDFHGFCEGPSCSTAPDAYSDASVIVDTGLAEGAGGDCTAMFCMGVCQSLGHEAGSCLPGGNCSCTGSLASQEECGDGQDNDGDGEVDEGCMCGLAATQACYPGPPGTRGVGICRDGVQSCSGDMEFYTWGPCEGSVLPGAEACDGADNDCNGVIDDGCEHECDPGEFTTEVSCTDGVDNDCDGLVDCEDPECPSCCVPVAEICDNGADDDCDGLADCDDPNCRSKPEDCSNGVDDNCDGLADCNDPACPACCPPGTCACCIPGTYRWCDTPTYCSWGRQQCQPDGRWGYCSESSPPAGCGGSAYNSSCCVAIGQCCQNYPYNTSIGSCTGIADDCE